MLPISFPKSMPMARIFLGVKCLNITARTAASLRSVGKELGYGGVLGHIWVLSLDSLYEFCIKLSAVRPTMLLFSICEKFA